MENDPNELKIDNKGSITFCESGFGKRTNYLNTKFRFLMQQKDADAYLPVYVASKENTADIFTKNLTQNLFDVHTHTFFSSQ